MMMEIFFSAPALMKFHLTIIMRVWWLNFADFYDLVGSLSAFG